jgi:hypothetical protein
MRFNPAVATNSDSHCAGVARMWIEVWMIGNSNVACARKAPATRPLDLNLGLLICTNRIVPVPLNRATMVVIDTSAQPTPAWGLYDVSKSATRGSLLWAFER